MGVELKINQNTSYLSVYKVVVKKKNMIHQLGGGGGGGGGGELTRQVYLPLHLEFSKFQQALLY